MLTRTYSPVWSKYRPAILKLMIDSEHGPQTYQLSNHEFRALSANKKSGYSFSLEISGGKVVSGLKESEVAQDLWTMLQESPKATALIAIATYQFVMDKQFILHIQKINS